jgi:hypothetical protein
MPFSLSRARNHRGECFVLLNRRRDGGVAQEFLHEFGVYTLAEQQGRARVSQVVEADVRNPPL